MLCRRAQRSYIVSSATQRVETLVWVFIYAGLLIAGLGLAVGRAHAALGWSFGVVGGALASVGVVLIWIRSRMNAGAER